MASPLPAPSQLHQVLLEFDPFTATADVTPTTGPASAPAVAVVTSPSPVTAAVAPSASAVAASGSDSGSVSLGAPVRTAAAALPSSTPSLERAISRDVSGLPLDAHIAAAAGGSSGGGGGGGGGGSASGYEADAAGSGAAGQPRFSFARFLEQWKRPEANGLNAAVKKFVTEQLTKPLAVDQQSEEVQDFLLTMASEMGKNVLWRDTSDVEFDHALEGLEKVVMNKLHDRLFCPATADDEQRDDVLRRKLALLRWVREEHLDINVTEFNDVYIRNAADELLKLNKYKAPRDKVICILNCCKIIYILLRKSGNEAGADSFLPLLILVIIRANPPKLVSNVQYISRFRGQNRLRSEAGYYFTNVVGAISFIESMDKNSLTVSQEDFDRNVEIALRQFEEEEDRALQARAATAPAAAAPTLAAPPATPAAGTTALAAVGPSPAAVAASSGAGSASAPAPAPASAPATGASTVTGISLTANGPSPAAPVSSKQAAPASPALASGLAAALPSFSLATLSQHLFGTVSGTGANATAAPTAVARPPAMPPRPLPGSGAALTRNASAPQVVPQGSTAASASVVLPPARPLPPTPTATAAIASTSARPSGLPAEPPGPHPPGVSATGTTSASAPVPAAAIDVPRPNPRRSDRELDEEYEVQLAMALSLSVKDAELNGIPIAPDTPRPDATPAAADPRPL